MKRYFLFIALASFYFTSTGQTQHIRFTARKNPSFGNQIQVYAKNTSSSNIQGILGTSNLTICLAFPATYSAAPIITSPINGQTFGAPFKGKTGTDSIYAWNGAGNTEEVGFPPDMEVLVANVSFNTGAGILSLVKLFNAPNGGAGGFDYNYIAPNGFEHCSYSNPFYSIISGDPLLQNANGSNDAYTQGASSLSILGVVLPIKFTSFSVVKVNDNAFLNWKVESEDNTGLYYDVQYSFDAVNFSNGIQVAAFNNGQQNNTYSATDPNITRYGKGTIYYRIKQTEINGAVVYSTVRKIDLDRKTPLVSLFPNPVAGDAKLVIQSARSSVASVIIGDVTGKTLQQFKLSLTAGKNEKIINASAWPAGYYLLTVSVGNNSETIKMEKLQ